MKSLFLIFSLLSAFAAGAQLKTTPVCPPLMFDVLDGSINRTIHPKSTQGEIIKLFPCASDVIDADSATCAGVFYRDRGIYFYTERDYIEIRDNYTGKSSLPLLGASRNSLFGVLGNPKIKDVSWDAYQMQYGTLVVYYNKDGKLNKIQFSNRTVETLKLCE